MEYMPSEARDEDNAHQLEVAAEEETTKRRLVLAKNIAFGVLVAATLISLVGLILLILLPYFAGKHHIEYKLSEVAIGAAFGFLTWCIRLLLKMLLKKGEKEEQS